MKKPAHRTMYSFCQPIFRQPLLFVTKPRRLKTVLQNTAQKINPTARVRLIFLVGPVGIEPTTHSFENGVGPCVGSKPESARCSDSVRITSNLAACNHWTSIGCQSWLVHRAIRPCTGGKARQGQLQSSLLRPKGLPTSTDPPNSFGI